jgi:TusA-related sulfurtransferase
VRKEEVDIVAGMKMEMEVGKFVEVEVEDGKFEKAVREFVRFG